ncbi:MAG: 3-deoxy-manno-octulosonate cytidylyltransferase [Acetobacteraceae bacterium]|nr:3-deoxy-manno-octulosonate cytidylyltransferase [Acetobacteraceae bacterium]
MNSVIVIPARFGSTRFPGKPLAQVQGIPMLQRVWALAASVPEASRVVIATDHPDIESLCRAIGAEVVRTAGVFRSGTDRVYAIISRIEPTPDVVVNFQGDAVLTPPWVVQSVVRSFSDDNTVQMATPAVRMSPEALAKLRDQKRSGEAGGTTVVFDRMNNALYFSKSIIPCARDPGQAVVHRHIGLYAYRAKTLGRLVATEQGPLERQEQLEQLRALEHGVPIRVVLVDYQGRTHWSIDSQHDLLRAERLIVDEGELLPAYDGSFRLSS